MKNYVIGKQLGWAAVLAALYLLAVAIMPTIVTAQGAPANPAPGSTIEQRIAQRKAERAITLDEKTTKRYQGTCVNAQAKIREMQQKNTTVAANRNLAYQQMDAKLWVIIGKLKIGKKDTFKLEQQRAALADKVSNFQATTQNYQQTLDDLVVINCKADVVTFKALLDTARLYRTSIRTQTTAMHDQIVNEVKPVLSGFASELQAKPATEGN